LPPERADVAASPRCSYQCATSWRIAVFNESRIIVHGEHVEHWLNGTRVLSYETTNPAIRSALRNMLPKDAAAGAPLVVESPISLQNHSSEVWFKNIKIRTVQ